MWVLWEIIWNSTLIRLENSKNSFSSNSQFDVHKSNSLIVFLHVFFNFLLYKTPNFSFSLSNSYSGVILWHDNPFILSVYYWIRMCQSMLNAEQNIIIIMQKSPKIRNLRCCIIRIQKVPQANEMKVWKPPCKKYIK